MIMVKTKNSRNRRPRRNNEAGPPNSAESYNGPVILAPMVKQIDTFDRVLTDSVNVAATAGGVYNTVFQTDPTSMTQWANMVGNVDEYRVLGMRVHFVPVNKRNQTLAVAYGAGVAPVVTVIDNNSVVALSSLQVGCEFGSHKLHSFADSWTVEAKATSKNHMLWVDTNNSPTYVFSIKTYSTGNFASISLGVAFVTRLIQFRGTV